MHGLPDPNGPFSAHVPSDNGIGWPTETISGAVAEYLLSWQHMKERNMVHTTGK